MCRQLCTITIPQFTTSQFGIIVLRYLEHQHNRANSHLQHTIRYVVFAVFTYLTFITFSGLGKAQRCKRSGVRATIQYAAIAKFIPLSPEATNHRAIRTA